MKNRFTLMVLLLTGFTLGFSQGQGDVWFFGKGVFMDFSNVTPLLNGYATNMESRESSAVLCDRQGDLEFYAAGRSFFNRSHTTVSGWTTPSNYGSDVMAQGNLILPINDTLLYLFSLIPGRIWPDGTSCAYAEVSSTANSGLGQVLSWDNIIGDSMTEHFSAVRHADGESWWVLSHYTQSDIFIKYKFDSQGNINRSSQQIGGTHPPLWEDYISPLVFDEQGERFALSSDFGRVEIYDFDRCTGDISAFNTIVKDFIYTNGFYGLSFSPNGKLLYVSDRMYVDPFIPQEHSSRLFQYNLDSADILNSEVLVYTAPPPCEPWWPGPTCRRAFGGHKLGRDGKIYIGNAADDGNDSVYDSLSVIHNPNLPGLACDYRHKEFGLNPGRGSSAFPNIPNYRLGPSVDQVAEAGIDTILCPGESITLGEPDTSGTLTFTWWTINGSNQTLSTTDVAQPIAMPTTATTYYLSVEDTTVHASCSSTIDSVHIDLFDTTGTPVAVAGPDTLICQGDLVELGQGDPSNGVWLYSWTPTTGLDDPTIANPLASPTQLTTYTLEVWDLEEGQQVPCRTDFDSVTVEVEEPLEHPFPEDQAFCPGEVLSIGVTPIAGFEYRWEPPMGLRDPFVSQTLVAPEEEVSYQLTITDLSKITPNCRVRTDMVNLRTDGCVLQNVITPNGDGINDVLFLGNFNQSVQISIFDRWGKAVYTASSYINDFAGGNLPDGVYYYVLKVSGDGGKEQVGNFVLLR